MRLLLLPLALLTFNAQAHWGEEEYSILDLASCRAFSISSEMGPGLLDDEKKQAALHSKYGDGSIFTSSHIAVGFVGAEDGYAVCKSDNNFPNWSFQCKGDRYFPIQSGAVFHFIKSKDRWAARCVANCGKSRSQKLYWVDTAEHEEGGSEVENKGFTRDAQSIKRKCDP